MKHAQHTPGTWHAKDGQIYPEETGKTLALIPYFDPSDKEALASAALIAAAPDLIAALQSLTDATAHYFRDFTHLHPSITQPLEQARAALLKACPQGQVNPDTEN